MNCGKGRQQRFRACKGGKPNDEDCPGASEESKECDTGKACVSEG